MRDAYLSLVAKGGLSLSLPVCISLIFRLTCEEERRVCGIFHFFLLREGMDLLVLLFFFLFLAFHRGGGLVCFGVYVWRPFPPLDSISLLSVLLPALSFCGS